LKTLFQCSKCDKIFEGENAENECLEHEESCNPEVTYICYKCGKVEKWNIFDPDACIKQNRWHNFDLGVLGYGSVFDGDKIAFDLCDSCLEGFIEEFRLKEDVIRPNDCLEEMACRLSKVMGQYD